MLKHDILKPVLPEIDLQGEPDLVALIASEREAEIAPDPLRRLAALLPANREIADDIAVRLRLSNKARKRLACAAERSRADRPDALAYRLGTECAVDRLLLANRSSEASKIAAWHTPRLPVTGGALIKRGLPEGPVVARTLRRIEDRWVEAGFPTGEPLQEIIAGELRAAKA
jgi:poly(A) polymerase